MLLIDIVPQQTPAWITMALKRRARLAVRIYRYPTETSHSSSLYTECVTRSDESVAHV